MRWLRHNLGYKLLAFGTALALWGYVHLASPPQQRIMEAPVEARNVRSGLMATLNRSEVSITVSGPGDRLEALSPDDVKLWVDLKDVAKPGDYQRRILAALDRDPALFDLQTRPAYVLARVEAQGEKSMEVKGVLSGTPPLGYVHAKPKIDPPSARIAGPEKEVARVRQLVASVVANGRDVNQTAKILALDANGDPVSKVTVSPAEVRIYSPLKVEPASKELLVDPLAIGHPAPGYKMTALIPRPLTVIARGDAATLGGMSGARTRVVDVEGIDSPRTVVVGLQPVQGVDFEPESVSVMIQVQPLPGPLKPRNRVPSAARPPAVRPSAPAEPSAPANGGSNG
jgi:YbbR domain-containing protein